LKEEEEEEEKEKEKEKKEEKEKKKKKKKNRDKPSELLRHMQKCVTLCDQIRNVYGRVLQAS
jgi:hypothetical protein